MTKNADMIVQETVRIEREYRRREAELDADLYAPWQPAENFMLSERKRVAASLLYKQDKFPEPGDKCLEIGYGKLGWLADLISWGLREEDLCGIELDAKRAGRAKRALPNADLRIGDAARLPWENKMFDLVVVSTVFSSILNFQMREMIASEIDRVLRTGGSLVWYDLAFDNPRNAAVKGVGREEIKELFPNYVGRVERVTLAPPIARVIAPKSYALAAIINSIPWLRSHLLAVLIKN